MQTPQIRIGTRGSKLALVQAEQVRSLLADTHEIDLDAIEIVIIKTSGDRIQDRPLSEVGGKGLFTKEIESALIEGEIDIAVHSMKDMPTTLPDGLVIDCLLPREDPLDGYLSPVASRLRDLPHGSVVGSSSLRRQAQIKRLRPDIEVVMYRGNVDTRLRKLREGVVDATILACSGLRRLGLEHEITERVDTQDMLPAVAQGAIGIEAREADHHMAEILRPLNHELTSICVSAERALLAELDGSCRTPIAGLAELDETDCLMLRGMILTPDGTTCHETQRTGNAEDAVVLGADAGRELKARGGPGFFG